MHHASPVPCNPSSWSRRSFTVYRPATVRSTRIPLSVTRCVGTYLPDRRDSKEPTWCTNASEAMKRSGTVYTCPHRQPHRPGRPGAGRAAGGGAVPRSTVDRAPRSEHRPHYRIWGESAGTERTKRNVSRVHTASYRVSVSPLYRLRRYLRMCTSRRLIPSLHRSRQPCAPVRGQLGSRE